jgi:hypothetical protein
VRHADRNAGGLRSGQVAGRRPHDLRCPETAKSVPWNVCVEEGAGSVHVRAAFLTILSQPASLQAVCVPALLHGLRSACAPVRVRPDVFWHLKESRMNRIICLGVSAALSAAPAAAEIQFFTDPGAFFQQNVASGKQLKGVETFEESEALPGSKTPFPNPLQNGNPRPTFPNGIAAPNLIIQTNVTPGAAPPSPNPSSFPAALWVNGAGFIGSNSIKVGTDEFLNNTFSSIDLIFTTHDKTAVGVDVSTFDGYNIGHGGFDFTAYDQFDNILGTFHMPGPTQPEPNKNFFGVWSTTPIGRVNIWGIFSQPQPFAVDNIEMWVPEPASAFLLGAAGLILARRRG